jgi:hypothetical protein
MFGQVMVFILLCKQLHPKEINNEYVKWLMLKSEVSFYHNEFHLEGFYDGMEFSWGVLKET